MDNSQASKILTNMISHPLGNVQQQQIYNAIMPLELITALPLVDTVKQGIEAIQSGNYDVLPELLKKTDAIYEARGQKISEYLARVPNVSDAEVINFLKTMDKSTMAHKSSNKAYYLQRVDKLLANPNVSTFRQTAAMLARAFGHDIGEALRPNWRAHIRAQQTTTQSTGGKSWLIPALAVGALFLL